MQPPQMCYTSEGFPVQGHGAETNTFITHALGHPSSRANRALFRTCPVSSMVWKSPAWSGRRSGCGTSGGGWGASSSNRRAWRRARQAGDAEGHVSRRRSDGARTAMGSRGRLIVVAAVTILMGVVVWVPDIAKEAT